jgi:hypothetical protein
LTGWSIACAVWFSAVLVVTMGTQTRRFRWARWLKRRDACAYIPRWTFFAPTPWTKDIRLLWREQLTDGSVSPWRELVPPIRGRGRVVWNTRRRARKGVIDCGLMIVRLLAGDRKSPLSELSLPYLMVAQHVASLPGSALSVARQFTLVSTQGADDDDGPLHVLCVSSWHRQPKASSVAPILPQRPEDRREMQGTTG